ncbi:XisI protein [Spirosoma rhododendri]|uniref:XisI protein n=1 Tax=Spirosoma rhododendri TaxID=2728024 RepID=A0A7L5DX34_9BACT|nr:XisI protein [Spirosoma rhododendri]QJD80537.1 XisI protein [Spirosoma rhododendri]
MDKKLVHYASIITEWFDAFIKRRNSGPDAEYELITDTDHGHFQVIRTGWRKDAFEYSVVLHFQLKPTGKIWILVNNTDRLITDDLLERGIPSSDIVIGFLPEYMRAHSGFAVA